MILSDHESAEEGHPRLLRRLILDAFASPMRCLPVGPYFL